MKRTPQLVIQVQLGPPCVGRTVVRSGSPCQAVGCNAFDDQQDLATELGADYSIPTVAGSCVPGSNHFSAASPPSLAIYKSLSRVADAPAGGSQQRPEPDRGGWSKSPAWQSRYGFAHGEPPGSGALSDGR